MVKKVIHSLTPRKGTVTQAGSYSTFTFNI
jgi:hypothetical protein